MNDPILGIPPLEIQDLRQQFHDALKGYSDKFTNCPSGIENGLAYLSDTVAAVVWCSARTLDILEKLEQENARLLSLLSGGTAEDCCPATNGTAGE